MDNIFTNIQSFGDMIRGHLPGIIEQETGGEVFQNSDESNLCWEGVEDSFTIKLSNGAEYTFTVRQTTAPENTDGDDEW